MLRSDIIRAVREVLAERDLSQGEFSAVMTYFDTDSCALITLEEFMKSVKTMKGVFAFRLFMR